MKFLLTKSAFCHFIRSAKEVINGDLTTEQALEDMLKVEFEASVIKKIF